MARATIGRRRSSFSAIREIAIDKVVNDNGECPSGLIVFPRVDEGAADAEGARDHPKDAGDVDAADVLAPGPRDQEDAQEAEQGAADRADVDRLLTQETRAL
jgi:hypothetical protein